MKDNITEELCSYLLWGPQNYVTSGRGRSWRRGRGRRGWGEQGQSGWEWEGAEQETNTGGGEGGGLLGSLEKKIVQVKEI